jgi:hypothetical protein
MKTMEHAVREMTILATLVGFLGLATAMLTADRPAGWFSTSCPRCERTEPTFPAPTILFTGISQALPVLPYMTAQPTELEVAGRAEATGTVPTREEFSAWAPRPAVNASFLR